MPSRKMRAMRKGLVLLATLMAPLWGVAAQDNLDGLQQTAPPKVPPMALDTAAPEPTAPPEVVPPAETDPWMEEVRKLQAEEDGAVGNTESADSEGPGGANENTAPQDERDFELFPALLQGLAALLGTLALFLLLLAVLKRWGRRSPLLTGTGLGEMIGRITLSPQASIHFIRVKNEVLVVGVTQQSVNLIRTMDAELFDAEEELEMPSGATEGAEPIDFIAQLQASQSAMGQAATSANMDEELDSLKGDLQRLKQYFQESTREQD